MKNMILTICIFSCFGFGSEPREFMESYARLFGHLRYFHPSDEAATVDWNLLAAHGVSQLEQVESRDELLEMLRSHFAPVAPTLQIFPTGTQVKPFEIPRPAGVEEPEVVYWRHQGVGGPTQAGGIYFSHRTHRPINVASGNRLTWTQVVPDMDQYVGRKFKLEVEVGFADRYYSAIPRLMLSFFAKNGEPPYRDFDMPVIEGAVMKHREYIGTMPAGASNIQVGVQLAGMGTFSIDNFRLSVQKPEGGWESIPLKNPGFEEEDLSVWSLGWFQNYYKVTRVPHEGGHYLELDDIMLTELPGWVAADLDKYLKKTPAAGEMLEIEIGSGLTCRFPMALYSDGAHTLPRGDLSLLNHLQQQLAAIPTDRIQYNTHMGNLIVMWNVLDHFFPYWDEIEADRPAILREALSRSMGREITRTFAYREYQNLIEKIRDGHGRVYHPLNPHRKYQSVSMDWIDGEVVVYHSDYQPIKPGDVILAVNGRDARVVLEQSMKQISGSLRYKRGLGMRNLLSPVGEASGAEVVLEREGRFIKLFVPERTHAPYRLHPRLYEIVQELEPGIWYVDLDKATKDKIKPYITRFAEAKGIIWDLRGYPNDAIREVISHLTKEEIPSQQWKIGYTAYPGWDKAVLGQSSWTIKPKEPHFPGKMVLLTNGTAISAAETYSAFFKHYGLATVIGQPTAGANGNITYHYLPGGFRYAFTGFKVRQPDGGPQHLVGVTPHIKVTRTRESILAGRDDYVENALDVIKDRAR